MSRKPNHTGSLIQRKDGRWQGGLRVNGQRVIVYGRTRAEAQAKLDTARKQALAVGGVPDGGKRTVADLLSAWLDTAHSSLKPKTLHDYRKCFDTYVVPRIGTVRLTKVTPLLLQRLYADLEKAGLKRVPSFCHSRLHRAFKLAVLWGWLAENPCDRVLKPTHRAKRKDVWTAAQLRTFIDKSDGHWLQPLWLLAITTGCRFGELLALRWTNVAWEAGTVTIDRNLQRIGKEWVEGEPKTRAGRRTISLPPDGIAALKRQQAQQADWIRNAGVEWHDEGLVFSGQTGQPMHQSVPNHALARACRRLELPLVSMHQLRHLHASLLLAHQMPVPAVAARLGHANPSVTMTIYAHAVKQQDAQAATIMGKVLGDSKS